MNLQEIRQQYPEYDDLGDDQLAKGLHEKHYADMPFADFSQKIGYQPSQYFGPAQDEAKIPSGAAGGGEANQSLFQTAGRGLTHGAIGLAETAGTAAEYLGQRLGVEGLAGLGREAKEYWGEKAEPYGPPQEFAGKNVWDNPELLANAKWWTYSVADMIPSLAATIIPGSIAGKIAKGAKFITSSKILKKAVESGAIERIAQGIGGGIAGGVLEGSQTYNQILKEGGSEPEAARAGEFMAIGSGILNALATPKILEFAGKSFKQRIKSGLAGALWEGITEAGEEPTEVFSRYFSKMLNGEPLPDDLSDQLVQSLKDGLTVLPIAGAVGGGAAVIGGPQQEVEKRQLDDEIDKVREKAILNRETRPQDVVTLTNLLAEKNRTEGLVPAKIEPKKLKKISSEVLEGETWVEGRGPEFPYPGQKRIGGPQGLLPPPRGGGGEPIPMGGPTEGLYYPEQAPQPPIEMPTSQKLADIAGRILLGQKPDLTGLTSRGLKNLGGLLDITLPDTKDKAELIDGIYGASGMDVTRETEKEPETEAESVSEIKITIPDFKDTQEEPERYKKSEEIVEKTPEKDEKNWLNLTEEEFNKISFKERQENVDKWGLPEEIAEKRERLKIDQDKKDFEIRQGKIKPPEKVEEKPPVPPAAKAREPWEMNREEFADNYVIPYDIPGFPNIKGKTKKQLIEKGIRGNTLKELDRRINGFREDEIRQALTSGQLTPARYKELHEADYGPLEEFMSEKAKAEGKETYSNVQDIRDLIARKENELSKSLAETKRGNKAEKEKAINRYNFLKKDLKIWEKSLEDAEKLEAKPPEEVVTPEKPPVEEKEKRTKVKQSSIDRLDRAIMTIEANAPQEMVKENRKRRKQNDVAYESMVLHGSRLGIDIPKRSKFYNAETDLNTARAARKEMEKIAPELVGKYSEAVEVEETKEGKVVTVESLRKVKADRKPRKRPAGNIRYISNWAAAGKGIDPKSVGGELLDSFYTIKTSKKTGKPIKVRASGFPFSLLRKGGGHPDEMIENARYDGFPFTEDDSGDDLIRAIINDVNAKLAGDEAGRIVTAAAADEQIDKEVEDLYNEQEQRVIEKYGKDYENNPDFERDLETGRIFSDEIEEDLQRDGEEEITEEIAGEEEFSQSNIDEINNLFDEVTRKETAFKLTPSEPTSEEEIALRRMKGEIKAPEKGKKPKAVIPTEKIKAPTTGKQISLLPPKKGETLDLFDSGVDKIGESDIQYAYAVTTQAQLGFDFKPARRLEARTVLTGQRVRVHTTGAIKGGGHVISGPSDIAALFSKLRKRADETTYIVAVDSDGIILEIFDYTEGWKTGSVFFPSDIAGRLINVEGASKAYWVHNHPGGDPTESIEDVNVSRITARLLKSADISIRGVIIGGTTYKIIGGPIDKIPPIKRKIALPVKKRFLIKTPAFTKRKAITNSTEARVIMKDLGNNESGVLLMDRENKPLAFLPFIKGRSMKETTKDILGLIDKTNASYMVVNLTNPTKNMGTYARSLVQGDFESVQVLDVMVDGISQADDHNLKGLRGINPQTGKLIGKSEEAYKDILGETRLAAKKAAEPTPLPPPTPQEFKRIKVAIKTLQNTLKSMKIPTDNIDIVVRDFLKLTPKQLESGKTEWRKEGVEIGSPYDLLGSTTFMRDMNVLTQLAFHHRNLTELNRTAMHEAWEIAKEFLNISEIDQGILNDHFKSRESEADAFAEFSKKGRFKGLPEAVQRIFRKIRYILSSLYRNLTGRNIKTPEAIFGKALAGMYDLKVAPGERTAFLFGGEKGARKKVQKEFGSVLFKDANENAVVWADDMHRITVDKPGKAGTVVLWTKQEIKGRDYWRKSGNLYTSEKTSKIEGKPQKYLNISSIEIEKAERNKGFGTKMYQALIGQADPEIKGIISYTPTRVNKKEVPAIYERLGSKTYEDYQIIPFNREKDPLAEAKRLEAQGVSMKEIRQKTGWHRVPWGEGEKKFFKRKESKPFDEVVYRGDSGEKREEGYQTDPGDLGRGIYYTDQKSEAKTYAGVGKITETRLRLENPLYVDTDKYFELVEKYGTVKGSTENRLKGSEKLTIDLLSQGYDGIIHKHLQGIEIVDFRPYIQEQTLGKWRFEIDDSAIRKIGDNESFVGRLSDFVDHDELFEAYPHLRDLWVTLDSNHTATYGDFARLAQDVKGTDIKKGDWRIVVRATSGHDAKQTLIHEVQHAIQELEDSARGGSPEAIAFDRIHELSIKRQTLKDYQKGIFNLEEEIAADPRNSQLRDMFKRIKNEYDKTKSDIDTLERMATEGISEKEYRRLAGEYEARKAAERIGLTAEERMARPPWETGEVIPPEDLIVRMEGEKTALAVKPPSLYTKEGQKGEMYNAFQDTLEPVTEADYIANRKSNRDRKAALVTSLRRIRSEIAEGIDKFTGSISTRLGQVSPKLKAKLRKLDFDINTKYADDVMKVEPLLRKAKNMTKDDFADWDYARKNSDVDKINELITKYSMQDEYTSYRQTLNSIRKEGVDVGLKIGEIEEYSPRSLKDSKGFLTAIGKEDEWPIYSRKLAEHARKIGVPVEKMSMDMKADIISNMILGGWTGLGGLAAEKERKLKKIPAYLNKYYMNSDSALMNHLYEMRKAIEARKFFGKIPQKVMKIRNLLYIAQAKIRELNKKLLLGDLPEDELLKIKKRRNRFIGRKKELQAYINKYAAQRDYTDNISAYIVELINKKEIGPRHERIVNEILKARFHETGTRGLIRAYKNISYIDTMGSPISALTQIGDLAWAAYEGGFIRAFKYAGKSLVGKSRITKEDVGVNRIAQEFADPGTLGNAVSMVFKLVGLEKIDSIGKEALLNSTLDKYQKRAKENPLKLKKEIRSIFELETDSVIDDLVNDEISENVKLLVYHRLLDFQPVALSEMPQRYLDAGNGRLFYMLKTFTLKVFDAFRNEAYYKIKNGDKKEKIQGIKNLIRLSMIFVLANAGADELKDWMLGRKTDFEDRVTDNILRLFGVSKFVTWKARTEGVGSALARQMLPPFKFIDSLGKDIITAGDEKGLETLGSVPLIGKLAYWHIGRGTKKREDLWDRRLRAEKAKLNKVNKKLETSKDKSQFRRDHSIELRKLKRLNQFQGKLNVYRKRINVLKSKDETSYTKKRIQALEQKRTNLIKEYLSQNK